MAIDAGTTDIKALRVGSTVISRAFLGNQKIYDQLDYPTLDLNFAATKSLDPRITFTRASSGTYFDSNGVLQTATVNTPRFDHNPNTKESLGLLIEEQRTNSIRNNTMQGAVAGTPGTLPTNWTGGSIVNGLAREIVSFGEQSGIAYVDVRYFGTTTVAGSVVVQPEVDAFSDVTVTGQTWVASSFLAIVGGSLNGISAVAQRVTGRGAIGLVLENSDTNTTLTGDIVRYSASRTMTRALTTRVTNDIVIIHPNSAAIDITLRIGMPQLEQGAFATSVIPTSGAAATRSVDVATMTGANFSSWYRQDEGSFFVDYQYGQKLAAIRTIAVSDGTSNNFIEVVAGAGSVPTVGSGSYLFGATGGVIDTSTAVSGSTITNVANARRLFAGAYKVNDYASCNNGGVIGADTSALVPNVDRLFFSNNIGAGSTLLNGHIRRIAYYPRRLANTELQLLTS